MPSCVKTIEHTYITDTHDLYIAVESKRNVESLNQNGRCALVDENLFEIYHLDLDLDNPVVEGPILQYPFSMLGDI